MVEPLNEVLEKVNVSASLLIKPFLLLGSPLLRGLTNCVPQEIKTPLDALDGLILGFETDFDFLEFGLQVLAILNP